MAASMPGKTMAVKQPIQVVRKEVPPPQPAKDLADNILDQLTRAQANVVRSAKRRVLVIAGAGSGKTEVMARRVAWWVGRDGVQRDKIVAFTFTRRAAEEMKFRIRKQLQKIPSKDGDNTLGGMYVGTIHGFCLELLRELRPDLYYNFDMVDDATRAALVHRGYHGILGLPKLADALEQGQFQTIEDFLTAYDLLNEFGEFDVKLAADPVPIQPGEDEVTWVKGAELTAKVGKSDAAQAFATAAARYYAFMRARRFLDFSTCQAELLRLLRGDKKLLDQARESITHIVVDEVQDLNPVQYKLLSLLVGDKGKLTAVGDHRQSIFHWRGGRVDLMAQLFEELNKDADGEVFELTKNFRSTPRIIGLANRWAQTIAKVRSMDSPEMEVGSDLKNDHHASHVGLLHFGGRDEEAAWIASTIHRMVRVDGETTLGAHIEDGTSARGIAYGDIAILLRSSTDARLYMNTLEREGIPAVFRAGPDLYSQPEVLLLLGALGRMVGIDAFFGGGGPKSLPSRIEETLGSGPKPEEVIAGACRVLRTRGFPIDQDAEARILLATELIRKRLEDTPTTDREQLARLRNPRLREWLARKQGLRRVFPQSLFHFLLAEVGVGDWEPVPNRRGTTALFHVGQLSSLVKEIETPGWTRVDQFKFQVIALCIWGARNARSDEAPLLVPPNAVTITTVHSVKGLEFPVVFMAGVNAQRFPSNYARSAASLPFDGPILARLDPDQLRDTENYDYERRLMYVALTRAERYLWVSRSGQRTSRFVAELGPMVEAVGGSHAGTSTRVPVEIKFLPSAFEPEVRLVTSYTDLQYYHQCTYDFYLRKVLGFAPPIDQAFGYGRGVHNVMRHIHEDPRYWAKLAAEPDALRRELEKRVRGDLFYLRYTTGEPADNMRAKAVKIISDYVAKYASELGQLTFEPERAFETLIEEENVLVSGAIDIVRLDDPPRVTIIDFKSGGTDSGTAENASLLDEERMRLQVSLYGLAAKAELEYQPERGLVRYLGEKDKSKQELDVPLDETSMQDARKTVVNMARGIRSRAWTVGPRDMKDGASPRCAKCDFIAFCGLAPAKAHRASAANAKKAAS